VLEEAGDGPVDGGNGPDAPVEERPAQAGPVVSRRVVVVGGGLAAVAVGLGIELRHVFSSGNAGSAPGSSGGSAYSFLTEHEKGVVTEATARLIPGPTDDPAEAGHPGAREADVTGYINGLLGAMHVDPPHVWAGGPFSDRAGAKHDDMADFVALPVTSRAHWEHRLRELQRRYREGVAELDRLAGVSFVAAPKATQDEVLAAQLKDHKSFSSLLFTHAIEGCYSVPEYGGNRDRTGWKEIAFPGDSQPRGYPAAEVSRPGPADPYQPAPIVASVLKLVAATAPPPPNQGEKPSSVQPSIVGPASSTGSTGG